MARLFPSTRCSSFASGTRARMVLPVTSTFTGHLATAEAIYDGPHDNLVGIETFSGSEDNKTPQHAVLLGMSGAGKSVTVCDLLTQTEGYFAYTVIPPAVRRRNCSPIPQRPQVQ